MEKLGFDGAPKFKSAAPARPAAPRKRKADIILELEEGPRRRSGRIAGLEADGPALAAKVEAEEKQMEEQRVLSRKLREQVMEVKDMVEDTPEALVPELGRFLAQVGSLPNPRVYPLASTSVKDAYADKDTAPADVQRLKAAFGDMTLRAQEKVTTERVFAMIVHPEQTKSLVLVGDKYGQLGM
jgi:hypothetical protein